MSNEAKMKFLQVQNKLMEVLADVEEIKTDHSHEAEAYELGKWLMNSLDENADQINFVLEMGCCFDI